MDKVKKRQIKKIVSWVALAAMVAWLAAMPLLAGSGNESEERKVSILSGTVETGSIDIALRGGGMLTAPEWEDIQLPSGVKLREFLVSNGDSVAAGTPLAVVDRVSVMSAITQVQETMDYLLEQMMEANSESHSDELTAPAGGLVKQIFAHEGERVEDVMLRDGALAVLSLDGRMAVQLETNLPLATGDTVTVTFSDGTAAQGRVESHLDTELVVTMVDQDYEPGTEVSVTTDDGSSIGTGNLYVHNAWRAVARTGTIESIHIKRNQQAEPDELLFTLTDSEGTEKLDSLLREYHRYEELMFRLFRMYQSETIDAPAAGTVSGIEKNSAHLLSDNGAGFHLDLLVNAPNGDDSTVYLNFAAIVTGSSGGNWSLSADLNPLDIYDYRDLSGLVLDSTKMTQPVQLVPTFPVYTLTDGAWVQITPGEVVAGDFLLIAMNTNGSIVWAVKITEELQNPQAPGETVPPETEVPTEPVFPPESWDPNLPPATEPTPSQPSDPTDPEFPMEPDSPTEPEATDPTVPTIPSIPDIPGFPNIQYPGFVIPEGFENYFGNYWGSGSTQTVPEEPAFEPYPLEGSTILRVTGEEWITLNIALDQRDISKVSLGQEAAVRVDAIADRVFTGRITSIGTKGTSNGGSSKFSVEITLEKTAEMLPGMSATASMILSVIRDVPTVPLEALVELGAETVIYTGYDPESEALTNPVTVTTGCSDGMRVQILSGLELGDSFRYAYYDTLELSTEVDKSSSLFG